MAEYDDEQTQYGLDRDFEQECTPESEPENEPEVGVTAEEPGVDARTTGAVGEEMRDEQAALFDGMYGYADLSGPKPPEPCTGNPLLDTDGCNECLDELDHEPDDLDYDVCEAAHTAADPIDLKMRKIERASDDAIRKDAAAAAAKKSKPSPKGDYNSPDTGNLG